MSTQPSNLPNADVIELNVDVINEILHDYINTIPEGTKYFNLYYRLEYTDGSIDTTNREFDSKSIDSQGNVVLILTITPNKDVKELFIPYKTKRLLRIYNSQGAAIMNANTTYTFAIKFKLVRV